MSKMIKCKTCGADIASSAKSCPGCGAKNKKPFYTRWWFILIVIFVIIGALGSGGSKKDNSTATANKTKDSSSISSSTDSKEENTTKNYSVGDTVQLKDYKVTVNGVRTVTQDNTGYIKAEEGKEFFLVDCTVENTSSKDQTVSSIMMFKIVDKDGRSYDQALFTDGNGQLDGTVGSGRKITGEYCVQVPQGQTGLELEFNSSLINNQQIIVSLN